MLLYAKVFLVSIEHAYTNEQVVKYIESYSTYNSTSSSLFNSAETSGRLKLVEFAEASLRLKGLFRDRFDTSEVSLMF